MFWKISDFLIKFGLLARLLDPCTTWMYAEASSTYDLLQTLQEAFGLGLCTGDEVLQRTKQRVLLWFWLLLRLVLFGRWFPVRSPCPALVGCGS